MQVINIKARVENQSEFDQAKGTYWTNIREPSPDGFNSGSSYRVSSRMPLGQAGIDINCKMCVKNFVKHENFRDKQTGQPRSISKNISSFEVLEILQQPTSKAS